MKVAISGHRVLGTSDERTIKRVMGWLVLDPTIETIIFGGAKGTDTYALQEAYNWREMDILSSSEREPVQFLVIVPDQKKHQPVEAQAVIEPCADEILELNNPIMEADGWKSFDLRNKAMVDIADLCIGFSSGRNSGTENFLRYAMMLKKDWMRIHINGVSDNETRRSPGPRH